MSRKLPADERCEPRLQIVREDEKAMRKQEDEKAMRKQKGSQDQGIRKDERGQEQPADKKRAQRNR